MRFAFIFVGAWAIALVAFWIWLALVPEAEPKTPGSLLEHFREDPRTTYQGTVYDDLGERLKSVRILPLDLPVELQSHGVTDSRGHFEIELPMSAPPRVELTRAGHTRRVVRLIAGEDGDYRLPVGAELRGRVVDELTETPLVGVVVQVAGNQGWSVELITNGTGEFITWGPPGPTVVSVHAPDHADGLFVDVVLSREDAQVLDFPLERGVEVSLSLLGSDNRPLRLARVELSTDGGDVEQGRSDAHGRVTFRGLGGESVSVSAVSPAHAERYTTLRLADLPAAAPIRLEPACPWTLKLNLEGEGEAEPSPPSLGRLLIRRGRRLVVEAHLGDSDAANVMAAGVTYNLEVRAVGFPAHHVRFRPEAGADNTLTVTLRPGQRISGRALIDDSPAVDTRILITARPSEGTLGHAEVIWPMGNGRFLSPELTPGRYHVSLENPDAERWNQEVDLGPGSAGCELGDIHLGRP